MKTVKASDGRTMEVWSSDDYKANLCQLNQIGGFKKWLEPTREDEPPTDYKTADPEQLLAQVEKALKGKTPPSFKDGLLKAYYILGGARGLVEWAQTHPSAFYNICAKLLPAEIQGSLQHVHEFVIRHSLPPPNYVPHPTDKEGITYEHDHGHLLSQINSLPADQREALIQALTAAPQVPSNSPAHTHA